MADIVDPRAIKFSNEVVRPISESMRLLKAQIDSATVRWFDGMNTLIPNTSDTIVDGRTAEGINILVGTDINNSMVQMLAYQTQLNQTGVPQVISKPCVRSLVV
jgi:hypothetical protein